MPESGELVVRIVSAIVWPVTIIILVLLLRSGVVSLLARLREGEFPGVKVKFEPSRAETPPQRYPQYPFKSATNAGKKNVAAIEEGDGFALAVFNLLGESGGKEADHRLRTAWLLTGSNPNAAILACAEQVTRALAVLYTMFEQQPPGEKLPVNPPSRDQAKNLFDAGVLVEPLYANLEKLISFRNQIWNGGETDSASAAAYLETGNACLTQLIVYCYGKESSEEFKQTLARVSAWERED